MKRFHHLKEHKLTYQKHLVKSFKLGLEFLLASCCAFIHGIYPDILSDYSSNTVERLHLEFEQKE